MATTPSGIVYPGASDTPSRAAIETLATSTDAVITGNGWVTLPNQGTAGTVRYTVRSYIVFVEFNVTITIANGATVTLVTSSDSMPAIYHPTMAVSMMVGRLSSGAGGAILPQTDGSILAGNISGTDSTSIQGRYSYPVG